MIKAAVRATGRRLFRVGFDRRWNPIVRRLDEIADYQLRPLADIRKPSITSGMTKPSARSRTIIGPVIAGVILIIIFGGYVLFALLAGDV